MYSRKSKSDELHKRLNYFISYRYSLHVKEEYSQSNLVKFPFNFISHILWLRFIWMIVSQSELREANIRYVVHVHNRPQERPFLCDKFEFNFLVLTVDPLMLNGII